MPQDDTEFTNEPVCNLEVFELKNPYTGEINIGLVCEKVRHGVVLTSKDGFHKLHQFLKEVAAKLKE